MARRPALAAAAISAAWRPGRLRAERAADAWAMGLVCWDRRWLFLRGVRGLLASLSATATAPSPPTWHCVSQLTAHDGAVLAGRT